MTIIERVQSYAKERGIKQNNLAEACGVAPATISTWIKNSVDEIPSKSIIPLARLLGVTPMELLTGERYYSDGSNDETQKLIDLFDQLEWEGRHVVMATAIQENRILEASRARA